MIRPFAKEPRVDVRDHTVDDRRVLGVQLRDPRLVGVASSGRRRVLVLLFQKLFEVVCDLSSRLLLGVVPEFVERLLVVDVGSFQSRALFGGALERAAEAAGEVHCALLGLGLLTASASGL